MIVRVMCINPASNTIHTPIFGQYLQYSTCIGLPTSATIACITTLILEVIVPIIHNCEDDIADIPLPIANFQSFLNNNESKHKVIDNMQRRIEDIANAILYDHTHLPKVRQLILREEIKLKMMLYELLKQ